MARFLFKQECYKIIGCAMEVHRELGCGFLEAIYQEALEIEFNTKMVPYIREHELSVFYKGQEMQKRYCADFYCCNNIIVELKAVKELDDIHLAQVINYLKASGNKLGLLINFGAESLEYKRVIY